jgi:repressor LexA
MLAHEPDANLRLACFEELRRLCQEFGEDLPYRGALDRGFTYAERRVPFLNFQKGIYRAACQRGPAALSINGRARTGSRRWTGSSRRSRTPPDGSSNSDGTMARWMGSTKLNRQPPAETDIAGYFRISPPSAHQMVVTLEGRGLIERTPGKARSIRLLLSRAELPDLE